MTPKLRRIWRNGKRRIHRRLDNNKRPKSARPMFAPRNIRYELSERCHGLGYGGLGAIEQMVKHLRLAESINNNLHLLKIRVVYHESDHVLNLAYNALCDGTCLQDIELRRQDEVFLDALGAKRLPDPTTAGDFCRRFTTPQHIRSLLDAINEARLKVWAKQPDSFFDEARLDGDGSLVESTGECKEGMDFAYDGTWSYHPFILSLANTKEVLSLVNRSGNRPSHEGAAAEFDYAAELCFRAGFRRVLFRGDTDFSQTQHLDRWHDDGRIRFLFGYNAMSNVIDLAKDLPATAWKKLKRPAKYQVQTEPRSRPANVKDRIVREREYKTLRLQAEHVAEFRYRPHACRHEYRMIVVRKDILMTVTGPSGTLSTTVPVEVTRPPAFLVVANLPAKAGTVLTSQVVAIFSEPNTADGDTEFNAAINWGDGTSGTGTVQQLGNGLFEVVASHTYTSAPNGLLVSVSQNWSSSVSAQELQGNIFTGGAARPDLTRVPGINDGFAQWFNRLTPAELDLK